MSTAVGRILEDLRFPTPDVGARREFLIFEAAHIDQLDSLHRLRILQRYACDTIDPVTQQGLFTDLGQAVGYLIEACALPEDYVCEETGAIRTEIVDARFTDVEDLAADLVPSPAVHTGPGTSIFDEPHADGAA